MIEYIVIHCSDSPNGLDDRRFDGPGAVNLWHKQKGFDGIGYHFLIDESGESYHGRPIFPDTGEIWNGAHVRGYNTRSIGICLMGSRNFHESQLITLRKEIDFIKSIPQWSKAQLVGHYQLDDKKTCPNFNVKYWYSTGKLKPQ
tara:strand:+ start:889 stop:1320 length:432 start_codon:yes stop_codon:yes gene_type:complete